MGIKKTKEKERQLIQMMIRFDSRVNELTYSKFQLVFFFVFFSTSLWWAFILPISVVISFTLVFYLHLISDKFFIFFHLERFQIHILINKFGDSLDLMIVSSHLPFLNLKMVNNFMEICTWFENVYYEIPVQHFIRIK